MEKSDLQRFRNECVAAHNFYRAAHGTPPLCWSSRLAESAHNWAQQLASTSSLRYSAEKDIGENITCLWGSDLNGQKITRIWYEEGKYFDYDKPRVSSRTRSFCQVVWEGTREFGAAAAVTKHGKQIVVARYFPPANKKDVRKNVKKSRSTRDNEQPLAYDTRWSRLYLGLKEFHEECLAVHNEYRLRHGAAPLQWSAELAWEAQQWAEKLARNGELRHNDDDTVGENLAGMMGGELSGRETTDMWYEEIEDYDFDNQGYSEDTSNFTQIVWVASESLGVGRAVDGDLCVVVAFYEPPGNMEGSFGDNVLRMGSALRERKSKERKGFVPPPPDLESFRLECLVTHNYFRARHGSPPLVLSSVLTDEAQYWAERLLVTGAMEGLDNSRIGISVAVLDKGHISGIKVSELWYKEILNYDFDSPGFSNESLDFSQLVWLSSRKLGVGKATGAEGVTVVVARYEPVGNIDGLFVHNVKRRGHDRGGCEPLIFHVEHRYRVRTDSKSTNSFLSWEHEDTRTFGELESDASKTSCQELPGNGLTRAKFLLNRLLEDLDQCRNSCYLSPPLSTAASLSWSDLDQFDKNENIVHRADEQESSNTLTVSDHFTRLVWIDPNSPTFQRKGVPEKTTQDEEDDDDEPEDDRGREEEEDEDDASTAYEEDNVPEAADVSYVSEEPLFQMEETELEEADLFSDPEDDLYEHVYDVRRSLSLDSEGTEPETHKGHVLHKVAFFEMFQQGSDRRSSSNSETSLRRSLIQEELEELARLKRQSHQEDEEGKEEEVIVEDEHECQLEFDDLFPAHREGDEEDVQVGEEMFDDGVEDEDESLVSVSDTEEVLDYTDYHDRQEGPPDYEHEINVCVTHEFVEEEPSTMEIFEFSDEDASHQYADSTEEEDKPLSSRRDVYESETLSTAAEFQKTDTFNLCEISYEDASHQYADITEEEEKPLSSRKDVNEPETLSTASEFQKTDTFNLCEISDEDASHQYADITEEEEKPLSSRKDVYEPSTLNMAMEFQKTETFNLCEDEPPDAMEDAPSNYSEEQFETSEAVAEELQACFQENLDPEFCYVAEKEEHVEIRMKELISKMGLSSVEDSEEARADLADFNETVEGKLLETVMNNRNDRNEGDQRTPVEEVCEAFLKDNVESKIDFEALFAKLEGTETEKEDSDVCLTHEFVEDEPSTLEIFEFSDEDASHQYADISDEGEKELSSTKDVYEPNTLSTAQEFPKTETFNQFEAELPDAMEDAPSNYSVEQFETNEALIEEPQACFQENLDPEFCYVAEKEENADIRMNALISKMGLSPVENSEDDSADFTDFTETVEGKLLETVVNSRNGHEKHDERTPIEEVCEASFKDNVEAEIDFEALFAELDRREIEKENTPAETRYEPERTESPETVDEEERTEDMEQIGVALVSDDHLLADDLEKQEPEPDAALTYECKSSTVDKPESLAEPVYESAVEAVRQDHEQEKATDVEELQEGLEGPTIEDEPQEEAIQDKGDASKDEQLWEANLRDYVQERTRILEETSLELNLVTVSSDSTHSLDEPLEPLEYNVVPKSPTLSESPEITECVDAETREDVRSEINVEEIYRLLDEEDTQYTEEAMETEILEDNVKETSLNEDTGRASFYVEEDRTVDEIAHCIPSSPEYVSHESEQMEPAVEIAEVKQAEQHRPASLYLEEDTVIEEVETETPFSPKHIVGEGVNPEQTEMVYEEEETLVDKRASLFVEEDSVVNEVLPDTPSSPNYVAAESESVEHFENIDEESIEESQRASLILEEESVVDEVVADTPSLPLHIASECQNGESFDEINEETLEESKRASVFFEEETLVDEAATDSPSSPKHIAGESHNVEFFEEINEEPVEESKRASVFFEAEVLVNKLETDTPSSPKHIAGENQNVEFFEEISEEEPIEESKRASVFYEEETLLDEVATDTPSSPKHIAGESHSVEFFEEITEEPMEESKRASVFFEQEVLVDEVATDIPSSPKHIAGESHNVEFFEEISEEPIEESNRESVFFEEEVLVDKVTTDTPSHIAGEKENREPFEEVDEEPFEESKRTSLFVEEDSIVYEVTADRPSSPKHIAGENQDLESFEEITEEPAEESERASLYLEEDSVVDFTTNRSLSPDHIAGENQNLESFEEVCEESFEESKRASVFVEEDSVVDEVKTVRPSSPKHLAEESIAKESFEEVEEEPSEENKRASIFLEEDPSVGEVTTTVPSVPIYVAGKAFNSSSVEEIHEEVTPGVQRAHTLEESDDEARYDYVCFESANQNNYVAGEFTNSELLEVTDEDESPESDFGEHFEEFENISGTQRFVELSETAHIAGEINNTETHDEALEEVLHVEESLEYEDSPEIVTTTTDIVETSQPSFHVAGELSNVEPKEESSEEEKPDEGECAEEIEEAEVQASTVELKSPLSLLSIAAAALELKIDAAQQEKDEVVETKTEIVEQYREQVQPELEVPVIFVDIASEVSDIDSEDENLYYVEEEDREMETEIHEDNEETVVSYQIEEQPVSSSHVAAEVCESEFTLEIEEKEDIQEQREFAEPFEESEEGSVSELMSECSSSPLHVSSELKDFQDYETINEEYHTETYHAITYEESDYVSEKSVSKGLSPLYITEELPPQEIYEENILNDKLVMIETAQTYNEVEEPLETETSLLISEPPLQTAAEFSDSDYDGGVEEDDDLSERDFLEEFEEMEEVVGREIPLTSTQEAVTIVSEIVESGPQIVEREEGCLDEADNAQIIFAQEPPVILEQHARNVEEERVIHKKEESRGVWQMELKEGSRIVESTEEKGFTNEIQKYTVVSEKEQRSVEMKSSYQVVESKETQHEERIFMAEKAKHVEISQQFGEKVEVLASTTTRQVSSTSSYVATGFASEKIHYRADEIGGGGILHGEIKKIQEVTFTPMQQSSRQTSWVKKETGEHLDTTDELSESILEKEAKDHENEKFKRQLSEDEKEVRLLKSEVMEYKAAEQQAPLESPRVTVERETTFMKSYVVHSGAKDTQEVQQVMRQDDVLVILKDDEASLEEESASEQYEEEIDIMRMDEALSEEEFRGELAESIERSQSRSSKADSVEETDKRDQEEEKESDAHESDQEQPLYEEEVDISEVQPVHEEEMEAGPVTRLEKHHQEEIEINEGGQQEPLYEEEVEISEVQPVYEEEFEIQKVQEQEEEKSTEMQRSTVKTATFEEEIEVVAAYEVSDETVQENLEHEPVEQTEFRTHSAAKFEEELEVITFTEVKEGHTEEVESGEPTEVLEEKEISSSQKKDREALVMEYEERKTTEEVKSSEQWIEERTEHVETAKRPQPMDLTQVDLYDEDESASTRYYVELSSTESLERAFEEVEDETAYTETYVRQGDELEENLEEFILVRYSDDYDSSGEEDISDHREIYVIPEEENDIENNNVEESARDVHKDVDEPLPESSFEEGFENMGLEEIRESPEFEIDDSPEDELDEEEQRQLEEYERLESFVILEEKLSQVESDEDCDDENGGFQGEEGDENVFHSDVHSSSDETLHEDELAETMVASTIRQAAVSNEAEAREEEKTDEKLSGEHQEDSEDSSSRKEEEVPTQEGDGKKDERVDASVTKEPRKEKESSETKDEKTEHSSDSSGEQSVSSEGSLSSTHSFDLEGLDDFEQDCLMEHNLYRRQHRAKPLKWSEELAAAAKQWAEHMASANCLERCVGNEAGQNLSSAQGKKLSGSEVVEMWYKEATDYNFEVPAYNAKCGNFTQVVWASSREFGVAKCQADDGTQYVAALYKPAGNIVGEFKDNVKPPRDSRVKRRRSSARRRSRSGCPPETPAEREKFKTECVISHNYYRTFHNAPPLRWSPLLAAEAQNFAERLVKTGSLTHSGQKDRGENLAYTWDSPLTARAAVDMWYDEVQDYDFECPGYTSDTGHFTQLVWAGTEEFGMGMAVAPDGRNVVVGRYFPPGNIVGQFNENVQPRQIAGIP